MVYFENFQKYLYINLKNSFMLDISMLYKRHIPQVTRKNGLIERWVRWTFYFTIETDQLVAYIVQFNAFRLFFVGVMLKLMSMQTSPLQLAHWKTTVKHLFERYRQEYAKIGLSGWSRSTFTWNNLQTLNYMDRTIDLNKDFMHFSKFYVSFFEKLYYSS